MSRPTLNNRISPLATIVIFLCPSCLIQAFVLGCMACMK
jgi:predicted RNA-binding Zn-ribbon protein involved in translation (DUF1610 family)